MYSVWFTLYTFTSESGLKASLPQSNLQNIRQSKPNKQAMQTTTSREVISIAGTPEHDEIKKDLELYSSVTRMMRGANLSRQAIINVRDKGRGEKTTIEKIRTYRKGLNKPAKVQSNKKAA